MSDEARYAEKGRREPVDGLLEQAQVHLLLARECAEGLAKRNWLPAQTDALEADVKALGAHLGEREGDRAEARAALLREQELISEVKTFRHDLKEVAPMVLRKHPELAPDCLSPKGALGRVPSKLVGFLLRIEPFVVQLDDELAPYFHGENPSKLLQKLRAELEQASATQELKLDALPQATLALYVLKGRVLEQLEDLNRIGRTAFRGQPALVARFNKDLLHRARGRAKTSSLAEG
jgi:hypothetical protein